MSIIIDENPTRKKIILHLKKAEHMTVAELSNVIGITPMAVRQHLMSLEKRGIVHYTTKKYGIGRPVFQYRLTEKAKDIFPKSYFSLVRDMLEGIEKMDGREKLDTLFRQRKDRMVTEKMRELEAANNADDRVKRFAASIDRDGFMVEMEEDDASWRVKQFNCMLSGVAGEYPEACKYELELYREIHGQSVKRIQCQREGAVACIYEIPKK